MAQDSDEETNTSRPVPGGGRTLGSGPVPQVTPSASSQPPPPTSSSKKKSAPQKKFATLGDLGGGSAEGHGHDSDDNDDDDEKQDFFAGGEKSGLAVQNPDDLKKKILEKARKFVNFPKDLDFPFLNSLRTKPRGGEDAATPQRSAFTGAARTLGGDDAPSRVVEDPSTAPNAHPQRPPRVERILHFWNDGFSVDDGDLYRTDDPHNAEILDGIRQGRAPLSIMNVRPGQEVDVEIKQHAENWVKPKKKWMPFGSSGQRLGSPTPGAPSTTTNTSSQTAATAATSGTEPADVEVDESAPTITLQIRLGDGARLSSRFNTTHTIGDVYSFVAAASPASRDRDWVLITTFPSKELSDKEIALGDLAEFRRGGVVVQKWQ